MLSTLTYAVRVKTTSTQSEILDATCSAYLERIFETLDVKPEIANKPGATELPAIQGKVDFNDVVKKGQPLLELDDALLAATERQSAANMTNAQAALELALANEARLAALYRQEYVSLIAAESTPD